MKASVRAQRNIGVFLQYISTTSNVMLKYIEKKTHNNVSTCRDIGLHIHNAD